MSSYIVEVYTPRSQVREMESAGLRVRAAIEALGREGVTVRHVRTTLLPVDETCFHLFEATDAAAVEEVCRRAELGRVRVMPAIEAAAGAREDQSQA